MTARQKIEKLNNTWYGFTVFAALMSFFSLRASGMVAAAIGFSFWAAAVVVVLLISLTVQTLFGRALLRGSSLARGFLVFFSGLFALLSVVSVFGCGATFFSTWSVTWLVKGAWAIGYSWLYAKSFLVLTSSDVKRHCMR